MSASNVFNENTSTYLELTNTTERPIALNTIHFQVENFIFKDETNLHRQTLSVEFLSLLDCIQAVYPKISNHFNRFCDFYITVINDKVVITMIYTAVLLSLIIKQITTHFVFATSLK